MKMRVLESTKKALAKQCPAHERGMPGVPCYGNIQQMGLVCARRRQLVKVTNPGKMVTVEL